MRSLICTIPGRFEYADAEMPSAGEGYSILKVHRIGICGTDLHAYEGNQPFFNYPRILGHELAAEYVSGDAKGFETGEAVTISPYFFCGKCIACRMGKENCCSNIRVFGVHVDGGMRTYISVPSYALIHGMGLSFDELALVEPLAIGAHGVRRAGVTKNEFVLVIGAGPIGLGTMDFARIAGGRVIAMDINDSRLQFCRLNLAVEHTINALTTDATCKLKEITNGDMPAVVIDATGNLKAINHAFQYMAHGGRYVMIGLQNGDVSFSHPEFHKREGTLMSSRNANRRDFDQVVNCIKNKYIDPVTYITHRVAFDKVKDEFESLLNPATGVIKAMIGF
jgi:threonine dehydrogenase-like Zn-dependent dehydrogenase